MTDNESKEMFEKILDRFDKVDERLDKVDSRLDKMDKKMDTLTFMQKHTAQKLADLELDVKMAERDIRRDIHTLNDEMETVIEILKMNDLLSL